MDFAEIVREVNPPPRVVERIVEKEKVVYRDRFVEPPKPKDKNFKLIILGCQWRNLSLAELNVKLKHFEDIGMTFFEIKRED